MMELKKEGAAYAELDLMAFNTPGARRVRQAIDLAQQAHALACNNDELRQAVAKLQMARELSLAEHRLAEKMFETEREGCYQWICKARNRVVKMPPGMLKMQMAGRVDSAISHFYRKEFPVAQQQAVDILRELARTNAASLRPAPATAPENGISTTALCRRGAELERRGRQKDAIECYHSVIQRNPRHMLALARLRSLAGEFEGGR